MHERYFGNDPVKLASLESARLNARIAREVYDLRIAAKLTQRQLAARVGTSASVICKLEDSDYTGHSLTMLQRIATALDARIELWIVAGGGGAKRERKRRRSA